MSVQVSEPPHSEVQATETLTIDSVSKENVKPDSPTPHNLRTYKLSILDQLIPPIYIPFVFFYPNNEITTATNINISERTLLLKRSLSETLTRFFPFAGKINDDDLSISCNDEGAYYVETRVHDVLSNFLTHPNYKLMSQLLPLDAISMLMETTLGSYILMVQVNIFNCGGIAISICVSHKIFDGSTSMTFLKAWAATARGSSQQEYPTFVSPSLFPQNPKLPKHLYLGIWPSIFKQGKHTTRRFVFDASALVSLKAKAATSTCVQERYTSRVVAVTSLIWKCATAASRARYGSERASILTMAVNLRPRNSPPLPQSSIGNIIWTTVAQCMPNTKLELHSMVRCLDTAIVNINSNFIEEIKGEQGFIEISEHLKEMGQVYSDDGADYYAVTSLCKFGIYDAADFGWGKPIWFCIATARADSPVFGNAVALMDTSSGDGIEARVTLSEEDMAIFERDPELLLFASLDPSPLKTGH